MEDNDADDIKPTKSDADLRKEYVARHAALKSERESHWDAEWQDIADNILPRRGRFFTSEANKGSYAADRKRRIINSKPTVAARTLRALMTSGMASPARRWFIGAVDDPSLKEVQAVKDWAFAVEELIRDTLKKSNIYQCLDNVFGDMGSFGTSVLYIEDDLETVVRGYVFPIGSYVLANSFRMRPDTIFREVTMTTRQLVDQFGEENCSHKVMEDYRKKRLDALHQVTHVVEPNPDYEGDDKLGLPGMKFRSCWYEQAAVADADAKFLRKGGYYEDPMMKVRWNVTGEDVYGSDCPGFEAIGDAKVLQLVCKREEQAFDKVVNPPMVAPTALIGLRSSTLAGDITHVDTMAGGQKYEPAIVINPQTLPAFAAKVARLEASVEAAYYADLALMFQRLNQGQMTATEINARQQEQMLLLGSVMERSEEELLRPLLYRTFMALWRAGRVPTPPEVLQNAELKFSFVSIMSQAQKLLGTANIERLAGFVGNLFAADPTVMDKFNIDQTIDEYADALSVPPSIIRSDDEVAELRAKRAQAQAQAQAMAQGQAAAEGAKTLSQADTSGDNALTRLLGNVTGVPRPGTPA